TAVSIRPTTKLELTGKKFSAIRKKWNGSLVQAPTDSEPLSGAAMFFLRRRYRFTPRLNIGPYLQGMNPTIMVSVDPFFPHVSLAIAAGLWPFLKATVVSWTLLFKS